MKCDILYGMVLIGSCPKKLIFVNGYISKGEFSKTLFSAELNFTI